MSITRISSPLTFFFRWIVTSIFIASDIGLLIGILFIPRRYDDFLFGFVPIWLLISAAYLYFLFQFRNVYFDGSHLIVWNREQTRIELEEIVEIKRFTNVYTISYLQFGELKKVLVMSRIDEFIASLGIGDVKSIVELRRAIRSKKPEINS